MSRLYELAEEYRLLHELQDRTAEENEGIIPDDLSDRIDAAGKDFETKLINCGLAYKNILKEAGMVEEERKRMQARERTLKAKAEWLKKYIAAQVTSLPSFSTIVTPNVAIRTLPSKSTRLKEGVAPEDLPEVFKKITVEAKIKDLKDALKAKVGDADKYAEMVENTNVVIK